MIHARRTDARAVLLALLLAAAPASPLAAQEPADTFDLEELVVTATRVPLPREAVPAAVTVVDGEALRETGESHVLEALRSVPGAAVVQSGSFGGTTSLFLRGGERNHVKVLVDGVPVNEPGGEFDFGDLTTANVERVEIVRGPASVLYGSDAVTGVVHVLTRRGRGAPRASAGFRAGTYGTTALDASLTGGGDALSYAFSLSRFDTDGAYAFNNGYDNTALSGRVGMSPDEATDATLSLRYSDARFHYPTDGAGRLVEENAFNFGERYTLGLAVSRRLGDAVEARLHLRSHEVNGGSEDRPDGPADTTGFYAFRSLDDVSRRSADVRADVRLGPTEVVTVGAEVESESRRSFNESESAFGATSDVFDVERWNRAYYAQAAGTVAGPVSLTGGVRLEENERFGTHWTWRAGAAVGVGEATRVRATAGTGFKEPTFRENFSDTPFARGNPELDPERSTSWEVGVERSIAGGRARLRATYFDQDFRDLIQYTASPPEEGAPNYFNVGGAESRGVEVAAEASVVAGVTASASYTRLDTEVVDAGFGGLDFEEGEALLRRPAHAGSVRLRAAVGEGGSVTLSASRVGERDDLDFSGDAPERVRLPAYTRVDAAAELPVLPSASGRPGVTLTVRVDNVLDADYVEVANFPARGRTVLVGGRVDVGL